MHAGLVPYHPTLYQRAAVHYRYGRPATPRCSSHGEDDDVEPDGTRPATHEDVDTVAALAAARRRAYEAHQPRFWREAENALARHTAHLHTLVDDADHVFLVAVAAGRVAGFAIGRLVAAPPVYDPGGPTLLVDDFAVERPEAWASLGRVLLRDLTDVARSRGAVQAVVVAGRHDEPKRVALRAAGLAVASEWWTTPIDP